jgi:hypothetical protein
MVDETPDPGGAPAAPNGRSDEARAHPTPKPRDAFGRYLPNHEAGGRPPHMPTPELRAVVERLTKMGLSHFHTAKALGIARSTLRKRYRTELTRAGLAVGLAIGQTYLAKCLGGVEGDPDDPPDWRRADTRALIWFLQTRLGWREGGADNDNGAGGMGADFIDI